MKKLAFLFIFLPVLTLAQKVIILTVNQPPEFGFSVSKQDTTIDIGRSVVLGTDIVIYGGSGDYKYNWSPGATLNDSTIVNPLASPSDTTTFLLTVTDNLGCVFSVNYTVNTRNTVGSDLIPNHRTIKAILFPNPNEGKFKVRLSGEQTAKIELTILDNTGKVITRQTILNFTGEHTEVFQTQLVSGIYILRINAGGETLSRQFIIH